MYQYRLCIPPLAGDPVSEEGLRTIIAEMLELLYASGGKEALDQLHERLSRRFPGSVLIYLFPPSINPHLEKWVKFPM